VEPEAFTPTQPSPIEGEGSDGDWLRTQ